MYIFRLPIGDWSKDGHNQCDYHLVSSNKSVEEVREVHFKIPEVTGIDIHSIANEYEESSVSEDHPVIPYLKERGVLKNFFDEPWDDDYMDMYSTSSEGMRDLWLYLLQQTDPELELSLQLLPPMLPFYGFDEKKRHIDFVGYGTFE